MAGLQAEENGSLGFAGELAGSSGVVRLILVADFFVLLVVEEQKWQRVKKRVVDGMVLVHLLRIAERVG